MKRRGKSLLLVLLFLFAGAVGAATDGIKTATVVAGISDNVFTENGGQFTVLLVNKHTNELHIAQVKDNLPRITKTYNALHGREYGDKLKEGDNRTPEGFYYVTGFIPSDKLDNALYGDGAFTLNYPNTMDKNNGKTGHGIWIHGRGAGRDNEKSQGCVTLSNSDLTGLKASILPGTPVIISDNITLLSYEDYEKSKKKYLALFKRFIETWEKGDFEGFASFFGTKFRGYDGLSAADYLSRKKEIMLANPKRKVIVSNLNVFKENSSKLMYSFDQFYCSGDVSSYGSKKLYLTAEKADDYRIVAEEYSRLEMEPFIEKSVVTTVNDWRDVWQAKDLEKYISYYGGSFKSYDMDVNRWKAHKMDMFKAAGPIKINLSDIKLKAVSPGKIVVSFLQEYTSDTVTDKGIKTLEFSGCPGEFKIVGEAWRPA